MRSHYLFKVGEPRKPRPPHENKQNPPVDPRLIVWNGGQGRDDHLNLHTLCVCIPVVLSEVDTEAANAPGAHPGLGKPGLRGSRFRWLWVGPAFPRNPRGRLGFPGPTQGEA